jgi:hypothetical protein
VTARFLPRPLDCSISLTTLSHGMAYRHSTTAMANSQYEVDMDLKDSAKSYKAGTIADQNDMRRVGKTQELRVGNPFCVRSIRQHADMECIAQLSPNLGPGIYSSFDVHVGGHPFVCEARDRSHPTPTNGLK